MADQVFTIDIRRALFEIHGFIFTIEMQGCTDCTSQLVKANKLKYCTAKKNILQEKSPKKGMDFCFFAVH